MVDTLTALGTASSVVQLVDIGSRLLIDSYGLYTSNEGATTENIRIEELTTEVDVLAKRLMVAKVAGGTPPTPDEIALQELARKSHDLAEGLLCILQDLKVKSNAHFRTLESLRQALRKMRKKSRIEQMQKDLERIQIQVNTYLLKIMSDNNSSKLAMMSDDGRKIHLKSTQNLEAAKTDLLHAIQRQEREVKGLWKAKRSDHVTAVRSFEASVKNLGNRIEQLLSEREAIAKMDVILTSLTYPTMQLRCSDIHEAYPDTFTWIFESGRTPFQSWLEEGSGIFWVNGKAGSGKSTLMKFLTRHPRTERILKLWAAKQSKRLYTADFYFWNSGTSMQKSQEGLLQSLLYQILQQCPQLIPIVCEARWNEIIPIRIKCSPWSRIELSDTFKDIVTRGAHMMSAVFCFFIDGLDEYTGDHYTLIKDFDQLVEADSVKMCVSSRPWTPFRNHYALHKERQIILQELTQPDMDTFVKGMLEADDRFKRLATASSKAHIFAKEIRNRAEGVFLWVFLVVRSLLRGMTNNDDFGTLEKRLNELPTDLTTYFRHMLHRVEPVYQEDMAKLLLIAVTSAQAPVYRGVPLETAYYLPREATDPNYALKADIKTMSEVKFATLTTQSTDRVHAWCKDLLEVRRMTSRFCYVDFLHRTVKDFLVTKEIEENLFGKVDSEFNRWLTLIRVHLRQAKALDIQVGDNENLVDFTGISREVLDCAKRYELEGHAAPVDHLLELDRVGCYYRRLGRSDGSSTSHWSSVNNSPLPRYLYALKSGHTLRLPTWPSSFMALAIGYGLTSFVKARSAVDDMAMRAAHGSLLLNFALHYLSNVADFLPSEAMVEVLLNAGANPNERCQFGTSSYTVWGLFLLRCANEPDSGLWPIACLMLRYGADPKVLVNTGGRHAARMETVAQ